MTKFKIIIFLIIILLTTGCWNYRELNDIAVVDAIGIDKKGNQYEVSIQIQLPQKETSIGSATRVEGESPIITYQTKAKTIQEALNLITFKSPKELLLSHIDVIIISEKLARHGINDFIDFLLRNRETRKIFPLLIAKDSKAIDILKILTPIESIPGLDIVSNLNYMAKFRGSLNNQSFDNMLEGLYVEGREITLPSIEIMGPAKKGQKTKDLDQTFPESFLSLSDLGIFNRDKLIGFLGDKESIGFNFARNLIENTIISFPCDKKNYGAIKIENNESKTTINIKNGKPVAHIKIKADGALAEFNCKLNISDPKVIKKIEKTISKKIHSLINKAIIKLQQEFKSDALGWGEYLYRNNYKAWLKYRDDWSNVFTKMNYKIDVNFKITHKGSVINHSKGDQKYDKKQ